MFLLTTLTLFSLFPFRSIPVFVFDEKMTGGQSLPGHLSGFRLPARLVGISKTRFRHALLEGCS